MTLPDSDSHDYTISFDTYTCVDGNDTTLENLDTPKSSSLTEQQRRQMIRFDLDKILHPDWRESNIKANYHSPPQKSVIENDNHITDTQEQEQVDMHAHKLNCCGNTVTHARFVYISKGFWKSKMIIENRTNEKKN